MPKVTFLPDNKRIEAAKGTDLLSAAFACGVYIASSCGGEGVCGRCKVIIKKGEVKKEFSGRVSVEERRKGYTLACRTTIQGDVVVEVPVSSRLADLETIKEEDARLLRLKGIYSQAVDVDEGKSLVEEGLFTHSPLATKLYLELPHPTLNDTLGDLERLYKVIREKEDVPIMQTGLANIKRLGRLLRESNWKITATLGKRNGTVEIVLIEPGDTSSRNYGVALDIGTTTVTAQLVNLDTNEVLATKATHNKQTNFGDDVISRIIYATEGEGLEKLHHAVIDNINDLIRELIKTDNINLNDINAVLCAGNTTMIHLLLKVDPTFIRREPYIPTANFIPVIRAAEAGVRVNPRGLLACVPGVSTYVGGDIVAGVVATGIEREEKLTLLIDVGTNGEIVLGNKDWLTCCAASAGPAFEGSGVTCGMRATGGAIQRVNISRAGQDYKIDVSTIGNKPPRGICGSGYIDIIAELLNSDIIGRNGKFKDDIKCRRLRKTEIGREFVIVAKDGKQVKEDIVITESDIDNLKRSKGAIYAAALVLLRKLNLNFGEIAQIYIAGGFGTYLDIKKAISIGLLPDLPVERFKFIGNSSLAGAREILLSGEAVKDAKILANKMTYFELSTEPIYMDEYTKALFFPHTDLERFPSVKKEV